MVQTTNQKLYEPIYQSRSTVQHRLRAISRSHLKASISRTCSRTRTISSGPSKMTFPISWSRKSKQPWGSTPWKPKGNSHETTIEFLEITKKWMVLNGRICTTYISHSVFSLKKILEAIRKFSCNDVCLSLCHEGLNKKL